MRVMVDPALPNHRKIGRLMDALGCSRREAIGTVVTLWCNTMAEAEDGDLTSWTPTEIGRAAGASEKALESTYEALISSGFLEVENAPNRRVRVHGWVEHQGDIKARRDGWKQRQQRHRDAKATVPSHATPSHPIPSHVPTRDIRVSHALVTGDAPPSSAADEVRRQLMKRADQAKINAKPDTLLRYLDGWIARIGAGKVEEWLMKPSSVGLSVTELHDLMFPKQPQKRPVETINGMNGTAKCGTCNDTGKVAGYKDGQLTMDAPCSCLRRKQAK